MKHRRPSRNKGRRPTKKQVVRAVPLVIATVDVARHARNWWRTNRFDVDPLRHIQVRESGDKTYVEIDHTIPVASPEGARWRITTEEQFMPKDWFHIGAREKIEKASKERGRAIYCIDLTRGGGEVMAALSYHVDAERTFPLMITAVAFRKDRPELWQETRTAAWLAKRYVHALGRKLHRDSCVEYPTNAYLPAEHIPCIGFYEVKPPPGRRRRYKHCYRQDDE